MGKGYAGGVRRGLDTSKRVLFLVLILFAISAPDFLMNQTVAAAQITSRSVQISTAQPGATANYTIQFTPAQTTGIQGVIAKACIAANGTCTAPAGISLNTGTLGTVTGFSAGGAFARDTTTGTCGSDATRFCLDRASSGTETLAAHSFIITAATNQNATNCGSAANCTFFINITTYTSNALSTSIDTGVAASATTALFTVNAQVLETLSFCVGSSSVNDLTTALGTCSTITGNSLNLGVLTSSVINISPNSNVSGDGKTAVAELSTNAANGTNINYDASQQTGSGTSTLGNLRINGSTCTNTTPIVTDPCLINGTGVAIANGTDKYGMTVAGINCGDVTAYSCVYTSGTYNLIPNATYKCVAGNTFFSADSSNTLTTTNCNYIWDGSGTSHTIASSTAPVGNEALLLKFAATVSLVTPAGSYTAKADYVATPVF